MPQIAQVVLKYEAHERPPEEVKQGFASGTRRMAEEYARDELGLEGPLLTEVVRTTMKHSVFVKVFVKVSRSGGE